MKACPYRATFYEKLSGTAVVTEQNTAMQSLETWLGALEKIVTRIEGYYSTGGYGKGF